MLRTNRLLAGLLLVCASSAFAATTLNLKDADINTLIATVSEVTGRNFIVDEKVKGKVTVISAKPMSADGVYETFLAVLQVKGYAVVPAGPVYKIVPEATAKSEGGARISDGRGRPDDDVVTYVYQIQNISAAQLVPILRPLVPQWGHLAAYTPSNMLIITDRAANVVRLEKIISQMDQTGDREIELVRLQHAGASEVVRILTTLSQTDKQADPTTKPATVIADERSNSVLIGGDKSERQKLLDIITQLDVPLSEDGATQVVYLRYASAENLAPIMEGYAQQADAAGGGAAKPAAGGQQGTPVGGDFKSRIIADKDTNALVITAAPKTMRAIRDVIAQLDIKRPQVLVEAVIAEVSAAKSAQLGVDWAVFNDDRIAAAGILDPSTLTVIGGLLSGGATGTAAAAGAIGTGLTAIGGVDNRPGGTSFAALIKALQGDGDSNVLSTPSVVTTDNEESELSVGQEVPFLTGRFSNTGANVGQTGVVNPFQTIERKDVGLTLGLTPQINEGNNIKLKINLEVSKLSGTATGASDLVTDKRTLNTTVTVESGQILVLGGLIDDSIVDTERGIPFLSRIPLLGPLFQSRSIRKDKRNLMVFIRPAILRTDAEADYYTRRKYDSVRQSQIDLITKPTPSLLPRGPQPLLPTFDIYQQQTPRTEPAPPLRPEAESLTPAALTPPPVQDSGEPGAATPAAPAEAAPAPPAPEEPPAPQDEAPAEER